MNFLLNQDFSSYVVNVMCQCLGRHYKDVLKTFHLRATLKGKHSKLIFKFCLLFLLLFILKTIHINSSHLAQNIILVTLAK